MNLGDRHRIEENYHDMKAKESGEDFYQFGALQRADAYLVSVLGDLKGKRILEIGCGVGDTTVAFARAGAHVTAIDISGEMIELTKQKAQQAGLSELVNAVHVGGEMFDLPQSSMDIVYGHSILHHLNLDIATPKIANVLRSEGLAAFLEPLDYNPILNAFRVLTPSRRTPTEKPLRFSQLETMAASFSSWQHREFYFLALSAWVWYYVFRNKSLFSLTLNALTSVDDALFKLLPPVRKFAWLTVVRFTK